MTLPVAHALSGPLGALELAPILVALVLYARRASRLAGGGRAVPGWRQACFYAGAALVLVGLLPPVGGLAEELVLAHMAQHLLMMDLAAPLIVMGLTGPLIAPVLRLPVLGRLRTLAHPAVALPLWAVGLVFWHMPFAYEGVLTSMPLHAAQHASFLGLAILMWMPLLGPLPKPDWFGYGAQLAYIVVVRLVATALANVIMWSGTLFYPAYAAGAEARGLDPLADQSIAGAIMATEGFVVTFLLFALVFLRAAREGEESQRLVDEAEALGIALDPRRASRAVAAGRADELRARLLGAGVSGEGRA